PRARAAPVHRRGDHRGVRRHPRAHDALPAAPADAKPGPRPARRVHRAAAGTAGPDRHPALEHAPAGADRLDRARRVTDRDHGDPEPDRAGAGMSRRPALAALGAALLAVLATGCSGGAPGATGFGGGRSPQCSSRGFAGSNTVVLMAQAVPSATQLPCIRLLPAGWRFGGAGVARGVGRFWRNNDRAGLRSVQVSLTAGCDVSGLRPVPSDEEGTDRYERIQSLQGGYAGERLYVFPGGCATYRFRLA